MIDFKTVTKGSKGQCVSILQACLRAMQYRGANGRPIEVTGTCDTDTVYAINQFQEIQRAYGVELGTHGINDSSFGPKCWNRLLGV